jgi:hypothetical protein
MNGVIGLPAVLTVEENWLKYSKVGDNLWVAVCRGKGVDRTPYQRHMTYRNGLIASEVSVFSRNEMKR